MTPTRHSTPSTSRSDVEDGPATGNVLAFDRARIERAIRTRRRYRYVAPRVVREGTGWKVVSPNCSRNVDPTGGEIDIAWLVPLAGRWTLHARDHRASCWIQKATGLSLDAALRALCHDDAREYWQ